LCAFIGIRLDTRVAARIGSSDVVQETQLTAARRIDDYLERRPMPFRLWLRKTAQERLLMAQRRHLTAGRRSLAREVALPEESSLALARQFADAGSTPSRQLGRRELVRQVRQALAELAEANREVLLMRNLEQLSNAEVAEVLQVDPAAASQRYGRALLRLRKLLIDRGLTEPEP
jgi:RNA polymerase sigma-70 factor, ECF subfamily